MLVVRRTLSGLQTGNLTRICLGTNTDGVIIDLSRTSDPKTRGVVASFKHETTVNVTDGIEAAVRKVLADAGVDPRDGKVLSLTIGTTVRFISCIRCSGSILTSQHFINAVVQSDARRLKKVAIIRLAAPYSDEVPTVRPLAEKE